MRERGRGPESDMHYKFSRLYRSREMRQVLTSREREREEKRRETVTLEYRNGLCNGAIVEVCCFRGFLSLSLARSLSLTHSLSGPAHSGGKSERQA